MAQKMDPENVEMQVRKGNVLGRLGRYEQAVSCYDRALERSPGNILASVNRGLALHFLKRYDEAASQYREALAIKPDSALILYSMASSLVMQGRADRGLEILQRAVRLDYTYGIKAKHDMDFEKMWQKRRFQKIVRR